MPAPEIKNHPFFKELKAEYVDLVSRYADVESFKPGEYIFREGDSAQKFFIISKGKVDVEIRVPDSHPFAIQSLRDGDVLGWSSYGKVGFKGPKKATPYASSVVVKDVVDKLGAYGLKDIHVFVKGIGGGREGAIRALHLNGLNVLSINDLTFKPF